ncbi:hypothetical protein HF313_30740 [Massilia atriviolacea]|uniref:hypothetical protein n=1 Tax=Massilia atriviolacea TaxID=2495579 RepID=UPI003857C9B8
MGSWRIVVEDDGVGIGQARRGAGNGVALMNIRARLDTGFGARAALDIAALAQGTRATMRLPFRPQADRPAHD